MNRSARACENCEWTILFWKRDEPHNKRVTPFRCRSWRHPGECTLWKGAQDFARISEAIEKYSTWIYCVFTFPQANWPNKKLLYRAGVRMWEKFYKRFRRRYGKSQYVQTWERHKKGGAHVNVLLNNARLWDDLGNAGWPFIKRTVIEPMAVACGFGFRVWIERMRDHKAMAGYLTKLARELTDGGSKGQIPWDAPPHFRRLRATRGLLPKPHKDPSITGQLVQCPANVAGYFLAGQRNKVD